MSAIQFLISGGMASIGGDLPENEQKEANNIVKSFAEKVKRYAVTLQVPASFIKVQRCTFLFVAKDSASFHFVFADGPGGTAINYRDMSAQGRLELQSIIRQVRIEIGDVVWAFSSALNISPSELNEYVESIVHQYVATVLQTQQKPDGKISDEAVSYPEIASGLEKFRVDHPIGSKTAFIIMQFGNTKSHATLVACIKDTLKKHGIAALRADDKQYMDDLFPNIKTYMHACDFGIAVFERITENDLNPNISLEVGYMLGMGKSVLLLKDKTLEYLQTDLSGKLYKQFDATDIDQTMPQPIKQWLLDKGFS